MLMAPSAFDPGESTLSPAWTRPVRVCFLIDELNVAGTESQLLALLHHLDRTRVWPYLALLKPPVHERGELEPLNCPVVRLGVRALRRPRSLLQTWRFARWLRRQRIDVLMLYLPDSTYFGAVAGRIAGVPHILRVRNNLNHWMRHIDRMLGRVYNRLVTGTVVNCEAARRAILRDERPAARTITVLENGVDLERFTAIKPWHYRPGHPQRVGIVANLRRVKGLDVFVEAAAQLAGILDNVTFHIAGEGEERAALQQQIEHRGAGQRVEMCGKVGDIPDFLAQLDVAVLASRSEGMSNAVLEYMAAGRPIVATAVGATPKLLTHDRHGLLVRPDDAQALAGAITQLLGDREQAARLAAAARRRAQQRYSRQAMVERFEQFFGALVFPQVGRFS
jgi:glycosyltransferase involved in cell wall biosynthesis